MHNRSSQDVLKPNDASSSLTSRATTILLDFLVMKQYVVPVRYPTRMLSWARSNAVIALLLENMHIGLASVNPEVRNVRFLTKPQFKRPRFSSNL